MRSNNSYKKALHKTVKQYKHFTAQTQYLKVAAVYKCKIASVYI